MGRRVTLWYMRVETMAVGKYHNGEDAEQVKARRCKGRVPGIEVGHSKGTRWDDAEPGER